METRPKIDLPLQSFDIVMESAALLGLLVLLVLPILCYGSLPDTIPTHFNERGEADGFGNKGMIWLLPVLGLALWMGLTVISRQPQGFNFPVQLTPENAHWQYTLAARLTRVLKTMILSLFAYLVFSIIQVAQGKAEGLGLYFMTVFLVLIFGVIGYYFSQAIKKNGKV